MFRLSLAQVVLVGLWAQTTPVVARGQEPGLFAGPSAVAWTASTMAELGAEAASHLGVAAPWASALESLARAEPAVTETAAGPRPQARTEPSAPAEPVVSWSDCEVLDVAEEIGAGRVSRPSVGMSGQQDDDDPTPMCDGGTRCSPVPARPSQAVVGIAAAKALSPPETALELCARWAALIPLSIGEPEEGFPDSPFEPPRSVA